MNGSRRFVVSVERFDGNGVRRLLVIARNEAHAIGTLATQCCLRGLGMRVDAEVDVDEAKRLASAGMGVVMGDAHVPTFSLDDLVAVPMRPRMDRPGPTTERRLRQSIRDQSFSRKDQVLRLREQQEYEASDPIDAKFIKARQRRQQHERVHGRTYRSNPYGPRATEVVLDTRIGWGVDRDCSLRAGPARWDGYNGVDMCWHIGLNARRPWWSASVGTAWEMGPDWHTQIDRSDIGISEGKHVKSRNSKPRPKYVPPTRNRQQKRAYEQWLQRQRETAA